MEISTVNVKDLVEKGIAILTEPPKRLPTDTMTDAPLLGNGDLGAAIGGEKETFKAIRSAVGISLENRRRLPQ